MHPSCSSFILFLTIFICSFAQKDSLKKSIYFGTGMMINTGGVVGIGFEKEFIKKISWSFALGSIHPMIDQETGFSKINFDIGIKYYATKLFFIGMNYGFLDYDINTLLIDNEIITDNENKYYGLSLSIGIKTTISDRITLSVYSAKVLNENKNKNSSGTEFINSIRKKYTPKFRFGLMLGYNL